MCVFNGLPISAPGNAARESRHDTDTRWNFVGGQTMGGPSERATPCPGRNISPLNAPRTLVVVILSGVRFRLAPAEAIVLGVVQKSPDARFGFPASRRSPAL